jgi:hypothetical protein
MMLPITKILFPSSFWGIFYFFVLFGNLFNFRESEKSLTMDSGGVSFS